jgi:predicted metal-binding membrane protein
VSRVTKDRSAPEGETIPERVVHHERAVLAALILVPLACATWIVIMARDMYGSMTGASAWMMTTVWDGPHVVLLWAMWAVMMAGMMLPSVTPLLLLYAAAVRKGAARPRATGQTYALASGYMLIWMLFSVAATLLQRFLASQLLMSPMMQLRSGTIGAGVLIIAGFYQFTSLKHACLRECQSPLAYLMHRWRPHAFGALRMGVGHGLYCVGCCWALMLLLFVGGVMNLTVIAMLTILVMVEKLTPFGWRVAQMSGALIIAWGVWLMAR